MTEAELAEIEKRAEEVTPDGIGWYARQAARNDVPALCAEVKYLRAALASIAATNNDRHPSPMALHIKCLTVAFNALDGAWKPE